MVNNLQRNGRVMGDDRNRPLRECGAPLEEVLKSCIIRPNIQAPHFELKPVMFHMLHAIGQFGGEPIEDPYEHLRSFMEISDSFTDVPEEALRLVLFPFSLKEKAKLWLHSFPPNSIATWHDLAEKFVTKYCPPSKIAMLTREIVSFKQLEGESLYEVWERFKDLLRRCPRHGIQNSVLMETFYCGLSWELRDFLDDASARGALLAKPYNEAYDLLESIPNNNYQWPAERVADVHEVDVLAPLSTQISSPSNMIKPMQVQANGVPCVYCGGGHTFNYCPSNPESIYDNTNSSSNADNPDYIP